ncbi:psbP domain-containing protein 3, chloroplastic isoform X1 [Coffea eugenioides]|uniref:psbP domain-containing protein 3, chloroplastic isoform X1 n=1 Tax=Coffea eugenioides TaxID=49369 RepID=UPI000F60D9E6|nr:psbP domain-containing protein 3, chloroplastic isoform X1 [Coffea eugenioides]XP_027148304.1 psbP domain-containing protein 3, chloroplastic isoform X1 [Coffea eugenioides]XP_027148305.1 psbP domain-containing protein 3, chloroplastic isoform X1 [Coffea eugenioides]
MASVAEGLRSCCCSIFFLRLQSQYRRRLSLTQLSHLCTTTKPSSSSPFKLNGGLRKRNTYLATLNLSCSNVDVDTDDGGWSQQQNQSAAARPTKRRVLLLQGVVAAGSCSLPLALITTPIANANSVAFSRDTDAPAQDYFRVYSDDVNKFQILIPRDWQVGSGEGDGIRSLTAFYPQEPSNSNVSVVITGLGADFTRLESFGKVDAFAETLVSGLDRSWQRPPGVAAKLIDSKAANGLYYIEYTLQNPGESRRHLFSVLGIANNGWYNRLYTLTGQFVEEEAEKYGSTIEKINLVAANEVHYN